ncbi:hypothetical protein ABPG75_000234 [Micractinium tetrahymenae]
MAPRKGNRQLLAKALGGGAGGNLVVPAAHKRAQELYAQFKKGKKRARAQEEAEAMYLAGANSALCIALAKMHMTLAVEQALKLDDDAAREEAVLASLHAALQYAVTGAVQFHSIQCVVLCVFTLHCCRGRGSPEQKAQRQGWHAQLGDALPAGDKAKWAAVGWVDPRLESHATQDRFGFEWNQRGQHPTVEAWAEAVRDDWTKFMHKARVADTIDFKLLERLPTKNPDSLRELLHEVEQPVDRRLAGNVTPLNNADKEALKQRLDALDALDARRAAAAGGGSSAAGLAGGGGGGAKAALAAAAAAPAPPPQHSHHSLTNQWLPALHTAQLNKQKQKAEHKRLVEAQGRAQQRAALIREYLALKFDPNAAQPADGGAALGDAQLAASASLPLRELQAAVAQLAASRDLSAAEAELANANLALLEPAGSAAGVAAGAAHGAGGSGSGGEQRRRHVWYGDPLLSTSDSRHSVAGYSEMEELLVEHQRQDRSMFEYAGQLVCRDVEGWQAVVSALPVKPMLLREPCPDLLLDRFSPDPARVDARLYSTDLPLLDGSACAATAGDELDGGPSDDDDFSDALSRQDLQSLFIEHHAHEWIPRVAASWGYTQDQGRQFYQQWVEEGVEVGHMEFLDRLADAAKHAWLKDVLDAQLASEELPPGTAAALEQMRNELWLADVKQKERQVLPFDFLRKKRQRGHDGVALEATSAGGEGDALALAAAAAAAGGAPRSPRSDAGSSDAGGSSSGISWRSGSTGGSSLPHHLTGMAATDILDSYMRELLHNTIPCLDAVLGLYSDAQAECAARLLPEDRLGEARVEQMVRRGFAGHCMVQLIFGLESHRAPRHALSATMGHLADILAGGAHPAQIMWNFVTSERAAGEVEEAYRQLLELERRSQGRVMSRPVSACTRVLAPLLLQDWEHLKPEMAPDEFLHSCKCRLARMTLAALRQLHRRGRLMEGVLWQLNSYILNCLEKAGEAAMDRAQQEELGKLWEELANVAHDNQDCFNYAAYLPLRMMLPLYTFVAMLCAEAFRCAADIAAELEDVAIAEASVARLSEDGSIVLSPRAVSSFVAAAAEAAAAMAAEAPAAQRKGAGSRSLAGGESSSSGPSPADRCAVLADYASGLTEVQRAMQRLQSGGQPYQMGLGASLLGLSGGAAAAVAAASGAAGGGPGASAADLAERSRLCQQLHRLLYAEAVLGTLFQRCEDISDGLEATSQVLRFMAKGLDEFIAGTLSEPLPPAPPLHVEQQLRDAQYALAAADCAQLALMLSNERLRALCYADTLAALREEQVAAGSGEGQQQHQHQHREAGSGNGTAAPEQAGEPGSIAAAVERFSQLHADMQEESRHDRAALQQLASSLASPSSIPLLKSVDLENVAIVDSVLQFAQNIGNVSQPSLQPAIEQYRSILADKQAEAHERLEQVKAYVVAASRQLEHQRSQLGVLLEWCRIRQMSIIGQLRAGFCAHSALDQLADLAVRAAAVLRWEPELRQLQERERQANMLALQQELEAEQAEAEKRAARAEKRKAQRGRKEAADGVEAPHANGVSNGDADSSSDTEAALPAPAQQAQQAQQQQQQQQQARRQGAGSAQPPAAPATSGKASGQGGGQQQSQQAAAYQRMLEEFGLDAEAASFAQQLAAKQAPRLQDDAAPPPSKQQQQQQQQAGGGSPAGRGPKAAATQQPQQGPAKAVVVVARRPSSAPASGGASSGGGGGGDGGGSGSSGGGGIGSNTVLTKPPGARELMRVVGYFGDWLCFCGEVNKLWDTCSCGQAPPCRDWVRGICKYVDTCRFSHPPFDLPDGSTVPMSERIAKPAPDAPLYRKGQVVLPAAARQQAAKAAAAQRRATSATIVPTVPAVNAWQRPLQAALHPAQPAQQQQQQQQQQQEGQAEVHLAGPPPLPPPRPASAAEPAPSAAAMARVAEAPAPQLSGGVESAGGGTLGWNPIGSGFDLGGGSGLGTPTVALASADSSRAATPALGDAGSLAAAAAATVFPFPAAGSSLQSDLAAASAGRPWQQRNGSLGGASGGLGPTGDESSFLSQLMQGLDVGVGDDQGDADLASLLGPIADDVGGVEPHSRSASTAPLASPAHSLPLGGPLASPERPAVGPSLLDGLAAAQQKQQQQSAAGGALFAGFAADASGGSNAAASPAWQQQLHAAAGRGGGLLGALLACLWHCAAFRQLVLTWPEIVHKADPVVHALHRAFLAYGGAAAAHEPAAASTAAAAAAAELADTLAGQLFGAGPLGDTGEVLAGVYGRIRQVESMRGIPSGVDQCFGLGLTEGVQCAACGKLTRQTHYTQHFVRVHAASLRTAAVQLADTAAGQAPPLGQLLRLVEERAVRTCDAGAGGCGAQGKLLQLLERLPRVVALQLSWESQQQAGADVRATLAAMGERLDLSHLYLGPHPSSSTYRLGAMLCYRPQPQGGTCCQAFLLDASSSRWLATPLGVGVGLESVGSWAAMLQKFAVERIQPSLLFYMALS